jgi:hypothetical protein
MAHAWQGSAGAAARADRDRFVIPEPIQPVRRQQLLLILCAFCAGISLWQGLLAVQDNQFADGLCAGLGIAGLPPPARAMRLSQWVSAYDDGLPPTAATARPSGLLSPRMIVEHPAYFQANCGSKVWLLCFLAGRAGLQARELRLCDRGHAARHVLCEIMIDGRWAVFDPTADLDFRRSDGEFATAEELRDPRLLAANAARVSGYDARRWRFDYAERLHFEKLPVIGAWLRRAAAQVTGRPASELALPTFLERPRLLLAGGFAALALLSLAAASRPIGPRERVRPGRHQPQPAPVQAAAIETADD